MTPVEKRELKENLRSNLMEILYNSENCDDEKFFLKLIYAQEIISHELAMFDDIFERGE